MGGTDVVLKSTEDLFEEVLNVCKECGTIIQEEPKNRFASQNTDLMWLLSFKEKKIKSSYLIF